MTDKKYASLKCHKISHCDGICLLAKDSVKFNKVFSGPPFSQENMSEVLKDNSIVKKYYAGNLVYDIGERVDQLMYVRTGWFAGFSINKDGSMYKRGLWGKGSVIGHREILENPGSDHFTSSYFLFSVYDGGELCQISLPKLRRNHPEVLHHIMQVMTHDNPIELLDVLNSRPFFKRLVNILKSTKGWDANGEMIIPLSRSQLGTLAGSKSYKAFTTRFKKAINDGVVVDMGKDRYGRDVFKFKQKAFEINSGSEE